MQESWSHRQTRRPISFSLLDLRYSMNESMRCQSANVTASNILCFGHPHIQDSCLATGIQAEDIESRIFSLPNTISMTWINYFTFLYSSFPLYIYLFYLLLNASATPLKISQPPCNEIIHVLWSCRSWTMTQMSPPFATCLSQVITFSLTVFITKQKSCHFHYIVVRAFWWGSTFSLRMNISECKPFPKI